VNFELFIDTFIQNVMDTSLLEFIAAALGIASVWYAKKANILVFPTGIVSVLIYVYICFFAKLYADMGINFFYFLMSVYGWYNWTRKDADAKPIAIAWNSKKEQIIMAGLTVAGFFLIFGLIWLFKQDDLEYIQSYTPYVDSFTTSIFLIGMLLMAMKRVENWIYWIIGDIISIPLYFAKGLVFTSFQYAVFLVLAIMGYYEWKKLEAEN
jgi:nicotinamide mononucleotide transporter